MQSIFKSLLKQSILYLELKQSNAPDIILETEEKFINEKIEQFRSELSKFAEEFKKNELEESSKCSPCYICLNAFREKNGEQFQPMKCSKNHLMDDNNIDDRITQGCSDWEKDDSKMPIDFSEENETIINKKYSDENLKKIIKFICNKILSK